MKVDIEQIEATLLERKVEPVKVQEILKDLIQAVEEEKADATGNAAPKQKWENIIILNDPDGKIKDDFTGWVVTQRDGQDSNLIISKLSDAAKEQNESAKRKKNLLKCLSEIFAGIKPKFLKEKGLKVKTKVPVRVLVVNGKN